MGINLNYEYVIDRWEKFIEFLGVKLFPHQSELAHKLLRFPNAANIKQARQTGKSFILGLVVYFIAFELRWKIIIVAPVLDQTWAIMEVIHQVKRLVERKSRRQRKNWKKPAVDNRYEIVFQGRGGVRALSGSETASVESKSANLIIVDEHQDLRWAYVTEAFKNMLASSILFHSEKTGGMTPLWSAGIGGEKNSVAECNVGGLVWERPWQQIEQILVSMGRENEAQKYRAFIDEQRRDMLPEEFAAHHECKRLDTSSKLLVPEIYPYTELPVGGVTTVGFDFGRSIDKTIGTALDHLRGEKPDLDLYFITAWIYEQGPFDQQHDRVVDVLRGQSLVWDHLNAEVNGIGAAPTDFLSREFPEIQGINVNLPWKTDMCRKVNRMAANGRLRYNPDAEHAGTFYKDITGLEYKMTSTSEIKVDHSDFLSSLIIAMNEPRFVSVAA